MADSGRLPRTAYDPLLPFALSPTEGQVAKFSRRSIRLVTDKSSVRQLYFTLPPLDNSRQQIWGLLSDQLLIEKTQFTLSTRYGHSRR